jgi:redox-sensitive bicupin YhaK (pirin superfamily)
MADISDDIASGRDQVLPVEPDGLGAVHYKMAPGSTDSLSLEVAGGGQYALVLDGDVKFDGDTIGKHSCVFCFPEDSPLTLTAGNAGASVLLMQFPVQDNAAAA